MKKCTFDTYTHNAHCGSCGCFVTPTQKKEQIPTLFEFLCVLNKTKIVMNFIINIRGLIRRIYLGNDPRQKSI